MKINKLQTEYLRLEANKEAQKDSLVRIIEVLKGTNQTGSNKINNCTVWHTAVLPKINTTDFKKLSVYL
jgi:hypothetical protein